MIVNNSTYIFECCRLSFLVILMSLGTAAEFFDSFYQCLVEIGMRIGNELNAVNLVAELSEVPFFLHQREDYACVLSESYQAYSVLGFQTCVEDLLEYILDWP